MMEALPVAAPCSVIILGHNGVRFSRLCLESLLKAEPRPGEVIFVNNGSTDGSSQMLQEMKAIYDRQGVNLTILKNEKNEGCSLARNQAWEKARYPFVVFLDNDTVLCSRDLFGKLCRCLEENSHVGAVSPKLIYPYLPHPIQCAGCDVNRFGRIEFRGRGAHRHNPEFTHTREVDLLISACLATHTRFLDTFGGFDEYFHPVQYEDLDLCMKIRKLDRTCYYLADAELYHFEGITTESFGKEVYRRNILEQAYKFRKRWAQQLRKFPVRKTDYHWLEDHELGLQQPLVLDLEVH